MRNAPRRSDVRSQRHNLARADPVELVRRDETGLIQSKCRMIGRRPNECAVERWLVVDEDECGARTRWYRESMMIIDDHYIYLLSTETIRHY